MPKVCGGLRSDKVDHLGTINVLLTAIGCPGGVSIIRSLRACPDIRIIGTDMRLDCAAKYMVDEFYQVPPGTTTGFIKKLLYIVNTRRIDVVLPLATFELLNLSQNISKFHECGCEVCVSRYDDLKIVNNRCLLFREFRDRPYIPKYLKVTVGDMIEEYAREFGYPDKKVVIKPYTSHGSIGLRVIDDSIDMYENYRNNKPNSICIDMKTAKRIFEGREVTDIMMTEYLPGKEYGVDLMIHPDTHEILGGVVRDNGVVFHSEVSGGRIIDDPEIYGIAEEIASSMSLAYTINMDFKMDEHKKPKLLEINPRLPATQQLAKAAGINMPVLSVKLALGMDVEIGTTHIGQKIYSYRDFLTMR